MPSKMICLIALLGVSLAAYLHKALSNNAITFDRTNL